MTPQEKMRLEARLTVLEHLVTMQFASTFASNGGDPVKMAKIFAENLMRALEIPGDSSRPPELSALASGEIGDQADRLGKAIVAMTQRLG